MIRSILVANRGEIACRVIRSARALGRRSVAVFSDADAGAPHVALADTAHCIGPAPAAQSYLDIDAVIGAARSTGADAIHPGYGFLSENADFAAAVAAAGLVFIGPSPEAIRAMGDKARAKRLMREAGVPCVPGYEGDDQSDAALLSAAETIGFPVMVKAAAGGGGRGMRLVEQPEALPEALARARAEARGAFGSDRLILERALRDPRHVEVQIMADGHGTCLHLGERDCSVQRRHQKVVEEAPCPVMTPALRDAMGRAAIAAARRVDYIGAGTVEFLLEPDGEFHFLEMNTRLQVEHPVTEMVTGLDLVALQIAVADGASLPLTQADLRLSGHAIEARLYAEDPGNDFLPATGRIARWHPPGGEGIRVDAGIAEGQEISPHYDPLLAKLVARGDTREIARARLVRAIEECWLAGPATNSAFLADILSRDSFVWGEATTGFLAAEFPGGVTTPAPRAEDIALAAALILRARQQAALAAARGVAPQLLGWSSAAPLPVPLVLRCMGQDTALRVTATPQTWRVHLAGADLEVRLDSIRDPEIAARIDGQPVRARAQVAPGAVTLGRGAARWVFEVPAADDDHTSADGGRIIAPMHGTVISVELTRDQQVARGDVVAVLEAMKMQHQIVAPVSGRVARVAVEPGQQIAATDLMIEIAEDES